MKTFREIAEMHYGTEPNNEVDKQYRLNRINALEKLLTEQCNIADISTRLSQMITDLDNKTMNTTYDDGEHLAWDKDDIRCMKRTLQFLND